MLIMHNYPRSRQSRRSEGFSTLLNRFSHTGQFITLGTSHRPGSSKGSEAQTLRVPTLDSSCARPGSNQSGKGSSDLAPSSRSSPSSSSIAAPSPESSSQPGDSVTLTEPYAWIHLCVEKRRGLLHLQSVDIKPHSTDGPVFSAIHDAYFGTGLTSKLRSVFSLRVLTGIQCVHVSACKSSHIPYSEPAQLTLYIKVQS